MCTQNLFANLKKVTGICSVPLQKCYSKENNLDINNFVDLLHEEATDGIHTHKAHPIVVANYGSILLP